MIVEKCLGLMASRVLLMLEIVVRFEKCSGHVHYSIQTRRS